jgi:aerobic-type carbon monoxide dehydrogenase small subunit (CoxS/CutS family)
LRLEQGIQRGTAFEITIDGEAVTAYPGETLATVLLSAGQTRLYCGMGICFDCLVTLNGRPNVRACTTLAQPGAQLERQS